MLTAHAVPLPEQPAWITPPAPDSRYDGSDVPPFSFAEMPVVGDGETQEVGYASPAYPPIPAPPSTPPRRSAVPGWVWLVGGLVLGVIIIMLVVAFLLLNAFVLHLF